MGAHKGMRARRYLRVERVNGAVRILIGPRAGVIWLFPPFTLMWWIILGFVAREVWVGHVPLPGPMLFACIWLIAGTAFLWWMSRRLLEELFGRVEIEVTPEGMTHTVVAFGTRRVRRFEANQISNLRMQELPMPHQLVDRAIVFDLDGKVFRLTPYLDRTSARELLSGPLRDLVNQSATD